MTDSMKFGPEWLRNMNNDPSPLVLGAGGGGSSNSSTTVSSNSMAMNTDSAPIIMAQFRYGREEMLLLFNRCNVPPDPLKSMQGLYVEKKQMPINLITLTEEETTPITATYPKTIEAKSFSQHLNCEEIETNDIKNRMWNRGINSDAALRLGKPGAGPGTGIPGARGALGGRGGSVDRGRGRARGSYHYSRGLSYEESDTSNGFNSRSMRSFDRTQSQGSWSERNGGDTAEYTATSPRKEFGSRSLSDTNWRRHRSGGDEDDTWRNSRTEKWGRSNTNSWRESDSSWERPNHNNNHIPHKKPWDGEENNLPEWATENPSESGGSFDSSGAFHGGSTYSDDDDGEGQPKSEATKNSTSGTSQHRPANQTKKEPPNIPNGNTSDSSPTSLKQSQSATSLSSERRPTNHPITTSASFSGVEHLHTSQSSRSSNPPRREEEQSKPSAPVSHQPPPHVQKPAEVPVATQPVVEPKAVTKTSQEEEIEQRLLDAADVFVSRLMDEEEKDPPNAPSSSATPPTTVAAPAHTQSHSHTLNDSLWYYQDPQGNVQGPFQSSEMAEWFSSGYFKGTLLVRRACDERYSPLSELIKLWEGIPFMLDYYQVPPIKNSEPVVPIIDEALLLQVQMQQQQRFLMQRAQALAKLTQSDHYNSLTVEQQQLLAHQAQMEMSLQASLLNPLVRTQNQQPQPHTNANVVAMLHQLAQYQQHPQARPGSQVTLPVPSPAEPPPDPVLQLMQQMGLQTSTPRPTPSPSEPDQRSIEQFMNAFRQRQVNPHTMESVWGGTNTAPNFPGWSAPPGHSSLWVDPVTKGIKTEQEVLEEQLRAEEKKKEELRKQEELQRIKEEEERQRRLKEEEELERRRKEEEEREKEKERKRMQEEEERRKKEAAAAKKAEQDRLRKEEEKKRKEEEKRRKEEEKRKQEEEKKRVEEEKKKLEEERKKREEITKRQKEALKQLQEQQQQQQARVVKPIPAPWTAPETAGASLADIQKTERKQQQQLREQQEMLKAYQEKHQQEQQLKNTKSLNLKWAEPVSKNQPTRVKSLAEIQAEEHERMAKQAEKEKAERIAAAKDIPTPVPGSIWASAPQSLSWNSASGGVWGTTPTAVSGSGGPRFWDDISAKTAKPQQQAPSVVSKSQAKTKAKKEEASVMKLFEKQLPKSSKSDEFNRWCSKTLASSNSTLDIPTFVDFLLAFESHKEVREYIHMYLGNTQEANNFASEFIERRSRLFSSDQPLARPEPPAPTHSNHFQEVKGKNKKVKKGKMTKVDSRILGFNVTAAPDRINVGDRDYGEGL